jgi:hypothetical protein
LLLCFLFSDCSCLFPIIHPFLRCVNGGLVLLLALPDDACASASVQSDFAFLSPPPTLFDFARNSRTKLSFSLPSNKTRLPLSLCCFDLPLRCPSEFGLILGSATRGTINGNHNGLTVCSGVSLQTEGLHGWEGGMETGACWTLVLPKDFRGLEGSSR